MNALGLVEVYGYVPAVEALDSALKAANVHLVSLQKVQGGLVTVIVTGDVGAVRAAVDASAAAAAKVGRVISTHVIPRPSDSLEMVVSTQADKKTSGGEGSGVAGEDEAELPHEEQIPAETVKKYTPAELEEMKALELKRLARKLNMTNMTKEEIRYASKEEFIRKISEFQEREE